MSHDKTINDLIISVTRNKSPKSLARNCSASKKAKKAAFLKGPIGGSVKTKLCISKDLKDNSYEKKAVRSKQFALNYKTEMCKTVVSGKSCRFGDSCVFAHSEQELKPRLNSDNFKTKKCENFHNMGYCKYGSKCQFIHIDLNEETNKLRCRLNDKRLCGVAFEGCRSIGIFEMFRQGKDCLLNWSTEEEL